MKIIAILFLCIFISSCGSYGVGVISATSRLDGTKTFLNYIADGKEIIIEGKGVGNEFFVGKLFPTEIVRKIEKARFPYVPDGKIKERNIFAFAQLVGNKGKLMDCFIVQNSEKKFSYGGIGRCYINDNEVIDLVIERAPLAFLLN